MADQATGSGQQGAGIPGGSGAAGSAPSVDVEAIVGRVVEALKPELGRQVTGAVKRTVEESLTSRLEGINLDALKGESGGAAPKDPPAPGTVKAVEAQLAELKRQFEREQGVRQKYQARALRSGVAELVSAAKVSDDARELLTERFAAIAVEGEDDGGLYYKGQDGPVPLKEHIAAYLKTRPGLLQASARPGSGTGSPTSGWTDPQPKSKREVLFAKNEKGKAIPTPARREAFIATHGEDAWDRLPD
jgi:hypothetical protein